MFNVVLFFFVTSFGAFEVFSVPFVGLNKASVKSVKRRQFTFESKLNGAKHTHLNPPCFQAWKNKTEHTDEFHCTAKKREERPSTCKCSRDVVLDLDVHKERRQSERHVALAVQADVMETCRPLNKPQ